MEHSSYPSTVLEIIKWKNDIVDEKWPASVEEYQENFTLLCGGNDVTDVLYSFMGIYAVGVWVFNQKILVPDTFKVDRNRIRVKNIYNKYQYLCSKDFLYKLQETKINGIDVSELNKCIEPFAECYFEVGNLIPLWPGGNRTKGNQNNGYMDIPELFFTKYKKWFEVMKFIDNAFLEEFGNYLNDNSSHLSSLKNFLNWVKDEENYKKYIEHIVEIIKKRTQKISKRYDKSNRICQKCTPLHPPTRGNAPHKDLTMHSLESSNTLLF